jgi:methylisocitrate lyase
LVEEPSITVTPGSYDAISAMLAERAGFDCVFTSGFSLAASQLGVPDLGLLTMSENVERTRRIADAVSIPLVADVDTGYGNALNVRRTIRECLECGVAGVILEDQEWPKRCGHMEEKRVVPLPEHERRIAAAADARDGHSNDLVIIGRTDAREPHGLDAAIERGRAYEAAGADVIFVEAPQSRSELERVAAAFDAPTFANMIDGGVTPYLPPNEIESIGFDVVVYPLAPLFAATAALSDTYEQLEGGAAPDSPMDFESFEELVDAEEYRRLDREYARRFGG